MRPLLNLLPPVAAWRPDLRQLPIDVDRGSVVIDGAVRRLTPTQQVVLGTLLVRDWASREMLMDAVWGSWGEPPNDPVGTLRVQVTLLRRHLNGTGAAIVNLWDRGYLLEIPANDNRTQEAAA